MTSMGWQCNHTVIKCHKVFICVPWAKFWHFQCEKCSEKFMYRSTWSNHRVRCIEGPDGMNKFRKFTCRFCSSSFLARDHLRYFVLWLLLLFTFTCKPWIRRQHERIHTGEKPWKCDQCSERFQYRLKHYNLENYKRAVIFRNRWKTHVRKCTGSEPVSSKLEEVGVVVSDS